MRLLPSFLQLNGVVLGILSSKPSENPGLNTDSKFLNRLTNSQSDYLFFLGPSLDVFKKPETLENWREISESACVETFSHNVLTSTEKACYSTVFDASLECFCTIHAYRSFHQVTSGSKLHVPCHSQPYFLRTVWCHLVHLGSMEADSQSVIAEDSCCQFFSAAFQMLNPHFRFFGWKKYWFLC